MSACPSCGAVLPAARPGDLLPLLSEALAFVRRRWTWLDEHQCQELLQACAEATPSPVRLALLTGLDAQHAGVVWRLVHPGEGTGS